jgi:hypothetical protein
MRDENTKDLTQDEKLNLILAKVSSIEAEMSGMKSDIIEVKSDHHQLEELTLNVMEVRTVKRELKKRVAALEQQRA